MSDFLNTIYQHVSQNKASSDYGSQMILSGIPIGVTSTDILGTLKISYGLENVTVSIRHDNTAKVSGLSADALIFFNSLRSIMVAGHLLNVSETPSDFHQSTAFTDQQGRTNSFVPRNDDGKVSYENPQTFLEYLPYPQPTQGDERYSRNNQVTGLSSTTLTGPPHPYGWESNKEYRQLFHWNHHEAIANDKQICPICNIVLGDDVKIVNSHIDICLANSTDAPHRRHQPNVASVEAIETTSRPLDDENSTVYLVGVPQDINEAHIIDAFSTFFGDVLYCRIGSLTRIAWLKFACVEFAESALAAEDVIIPPDRYGEIIEVKVKRKATATLYVGGSLGNLCATDIQNHLSKVFRDHWKSNAESGIQDVLAFECGFEAAEKALALQGITYNQQILTFYTSVIYLEELPPTATYEKITNVLRDLMPTIGKMNVIIRSGEGIAVVMFSNSASKKQLLALNNIQVENKPVIISREVVPKVCIEDIPHELFQKPQEALIRAINAMPIFEGMISSVDLRRRERMAILSLIDTETRSRVLDHCQSFAPVLQGRPVFIRAMRAMTAIWEFDDEWYQCAQVHKSIDQYAADDSVFLREWKPEIWKQWKSKYADNLTKAMSRNDSEAISRANQQMHGIRVAVMLATLSAARNGYYCPSDRDPTMRIDIPPPSQNSEPFTFAALPPASTVVYDRTSVSVIKQDCLLAALNMKERGLRPVVLNMASATSPGGRYRQGDDAQEENIFRRSNYFLSLDDLMNQRRPTYPIAEFGGIYTPDITIFRDSEDSGYAFRQVPFTVDFIAVAAYRKPNLQNNCLSPENAARTRRKIEAIFAIALHKGHDSLLLSALGCGAFRNPPAQIAAIFLAVAQQYSRKFREIVFAIVEDHNSVTAANPSGNYEVFSSLLDHANLGPGIPTLPPATAPTVSTCSFGGCCDKTDAIHIREFYHPPFCPYGKDCKTTDFQHLFLFRHVHPCQKKGLCVEHNEPGHAELFLHPPHCENGGGCTSIEGAHLQQYLHVPACFKGMKCPNRKVNPHAEHFRHIKEQCRDGSFCGQYMVVTHMDQCLHPFNTPCRDTPFACMRADVNHVTRFAHVCKYGTGCRELSDPNHVKNWIHIRLTPCSDGANCALLLNEEHLDLLSHPEIADIRSRCQDKQECTKRSRLEHVSKYTHPSEGPPISSNEGASQDINFLVNAQEMIKATDAYFKEKAGNFQVPEEIVEWVKALRPAHRVRPKIFKSILAHHHVMSADHILKLKNPKWASDEARHHPLVRKICEDIKCSETERTHLEDLVEYAVLVAHGRVANDPQLPSWETELNLRIEAVCNQILPSEQMQPLIDLGERLVKATRDLAANPEGINYHVDKTLGTNKQVFSILGPHTGYYYGDIILLFKPDIMHHPQSNVTPNAATAFWSGRESNNRPFMPKVNPHSDEAMKKFHNSKLHPSCSDWAKAAAADICAQVMEATGKTHVSLDDLKTEWLRRESHFVFEAHLPSLIPLSFVDKIIIPKNIWEDYLTADDKKQFRLAFPDPNKEVTVICEPVGADFDGQLALTDERRKLINTAMVHCLSTYATTGSNHRPLGMSVTLERGKGGILPLPFRFHVAGEGNIYFRAKGSEFFVMLTDKPTKEISNNDARLTFYFGGPKSHILYIARSPPSAHRMTLDRRNWVASDQDFDRGFADGDWVNYHIQVDHKKKLCKVEHWGHSQIYNRRTLVLNTDVVSGKFKFQWLGIGVWNNQVSFESIEVYQKPLPEISGIQSTPQVAAPSSSGLNLIVGAFSALMGYSTNAETIPSTTTNSSISTGCRIPGAFEVIDGVWKNRVSFESIEVHQKRSDIQSTPQVVDGASAPSSWGLNFIVGAFLALMGYSTDAETIPSMTTNSSISTGCRMPGAFEVNDGAWKNRVSFESIEVHQKPLPERSAIQSTPQVVDGASAPSSRRLNFIVGAFSALMGYSTNAQTTPSMTTNPSIATGCRMPGAFEVNDGVSIESIEVHQKPLPERSGFQSTPQVVDGTSAPSSWGLNLNVGAFSALMGYSTNSQTTPSTTTNSYLSSGCRMPGAFEMNSCSYQTSVDS